MNNKKKWFFIFCIIGLFIAGGISLYVYILYTANGQTAEERATAYIKSQGAFSENVLQKETSMNMQGRWEIAYRFVDEPDLLYNYTYDQSMDRMLLLVFHTPGSLLMSGGRSIERGMDYPGLSFEGSSWVYFDKEGEPISD